MYIYTHILYVVILGKQIKIRYDFFSEITTDISPPPSFSINHLHSNSPIFFMF